MSNSNSSAEAEANHKLGVKLYKSGKWLDALKHWELAASLGHEGAIHDMGVL